MPAAPDATALAAQLQALEAALQSQAVRAEGATLAALLADEFIEFGSSGNIWTRAATLAGVSSYRRCATGAGPRWVLSARTCTSRVTRPWRRVTTSPGRKSREGLALAPATCTRPRSISCTARARVL